MRSFFSTINAAVRGFTRDWLPLILSVATVLISWMAYEDAHTTSLLSIKPSVNFLTETGAEEPIVGIAVKNAGPGPALVQQIAYFVDRKRIDDIYGTLNRMKGGSGIVRFTQADAGDTLAAGEQYWLISQNAERIQDPDAFLDFVEGHLGVGITYCALRGGCWSRCSTKGACAAPFE